VPRKNKYKYLPFYRSAMPHVLPRMYHLPFNKKKDKQHITGFVMRHYFILIT